MDADFAGYSESPRLADRAQGFSWSSRALNLAPLSLKAANGFGESTTTPGT